MCDSMAFIGIWSTSQPWECAQHESEIRERLSGMCPTASIQVVIKAIVNLKVKKFIYNPTTGSTKINITHSNFVTGSPPPLIIVTIAQMSRTKTISPTIP
jgi:hypothetical protein